MCNRRTDLNVALVALAAIAIAGATAQADVNPVGWWTFDDGAGTAVADSSANANHGVITGDAAWTTGQFGGALSFDGTDDYVTVPIGSILSELSDTTVTTWANFSNAGGAWQRLWDFGSGTGIYMFLCARVNTDGVIRFAIRTADIGEQIVNTPGKLASGWHNITVVLDSADMMTRVYVDGAMVASGATLLLPKDLGVTTQNWFGKSQWPDALYQGDLDDVRIYNRVLTQDEIKNVMAGGIGYGLANTPSPADQEMYLLPDVTLSWAAGQEAEAHDVYLGASAEDVAAADAANPMDVLVSSGQSETTFDAGRLEFGKTYYWRVDEVGPAPDFTVYKGNVWSFTVEPYAYTLGAASITATASSVSEDTMGPEKTIDGSGLNADGQHSIVETDMWLSSEDGPLPAWIQYEFDQAYLLNDMLVWNSNLEIESVVGYGAKDVKVEYSLDGVTWTTLGDFEFTQAPGDPSYTSDIKVDFAGKTAKFVKLTITGNWGEIFDQYGLSEVRFSYIPVTAVNPTPVPGTVEMEGPIALSWRPGRQVVTHEVYLGTDPDNLALAAAVSESACEVEVELDKTYYWQVVEVNDAEDPNRWASRVWTFKTKELPKDPGADTLAALYAMEDNIDDSSGNALNGVLFNEPNFIDGMAGMGRALFFDGTNDYAELPIGELMSTLSDITIATWSDFSNQGGDWQRTFDFGSGTSAYLFLCPRTSSGGTMRVALRTATVGEQIVNSTRTQPTGWHHVAVVVDSATMTIKLFLDGEVIGSNATVLLPKDLGVTTQNWLARSQYSADAYYGGALDDFRIYSEALSKGEIMYLAGLR